MDSFLLFLPFLIAGILGNVFAQYFTITVQVIVSIVIVLYFIWSIKYTTFEVSPHILFGLFGLSFIAGLVVGDIWFCVAPFFNFNFNFQILR